MESLNFPELPTGRAETPMSNGSASRVAKPVMNGSAISRSGSPLERSGLPMQKQQQQLLQQRLSSLTPEQQARFKQLPPEQQQRILQQHKMLQTKLAREKLKNHKFAETTEELLAKYDSFPPSLEFHIHESHFRFSNQDGVINKNSPVVKQFLSHVAREEIPHSLVEVIKDGGIQLYEGNVILKIIDHRTMVDVKQEESTTQVAKSYKTLLRPTQLSLYADLLYQTDSFQLRFSDQLSLSLEAELLAITNRNLNLKPPLNPYRCRDYLHPRSALPEYDSQNDTVRHRHLHSETFHNYADYPYRPLHGDVSTNSSHYENLMTIMSDRFSNNSTLNQESSTSASTNFLRLRFVENWRRKRERMKQAALATQLPARPNSQMHQNPPPSSSASFQNPTPVASPANGGMQLTPQQKLILQQQRMLQQQQQLSQRTPIMENQAFPQTDQFLGQDLEKKRRQQQMRQNAPKSFQYSGKTLPGGVPIPQHPTDFKREM